MTVPVPYLWRDSGAVSNFPAHDPSDRGWDPFCAARHVALAGAPDPATQRATRPQRLGFGLAAAPGARTRATACSVRSTRVRFWSDRTSGGTQLTVSKFNTEANGQDSLRLQYPVTGIVFRMNQSRYEDLGKNRSRHLVEG